MKYLDNKSRETQASNSVEHSPAGELMTEDLPWGLPQAFSDGIPLYRGKHRGDYTTLSAETDGEAIAQWLAEKAADSVATARAYRREAERFVLWAARSRHRCLSDLDRSDFAAYREFLRNPGPEWMMARQLSRRHPDWRPFLGPLNDQSVYYALSIVSGLVQFLVDTGYLRANPMPSPKKPPGQSFSPIARSLSKAQIAFLFSAVNELPVQDGRSELMKLRARWMLTVFTTTGMRISEACGHLMGDIQRVPLKAESVWVLMVTGKGGKQRAIPLNQRFITEMVSFRRELGLGTYPERGETTPLFPKLNQVSDGGDFDGLSFEGIGSRHAYRIVKDLMLSAADIASKAGEEYEAGNLREAASTHWLRHTVLRDIADETEDLRLVQLFAGHSNINTSAAYSAKDLESLVKGLSGL
ncbi:tyrosine-type recombinase/integrase [Marinobacter alkaliphilus]|uniref:Tyrosine-type recombinase/integrase n=1 Tax=Marinobacter alkaliphilus TaxID=254719 RepID=A0ABZ3EAR0_9GAMM